jgi:hypothetical protein
MQTFYVEDHRGRQILVRPYEAGEARVGDRVRWISNPKEWPAAPAGEIIKLLARRADKHPRQLDFDVKWEDGRLSFESMENIGLEVPNGLDVILDML